MVNDNYLTVKVLIWMEGPKSLFFKGGLNVSI